MGAIWLGVGTETTVSADANSNPYLGSGAIDILAATGPPYTYLSSGPVIVGGAISGACMKEGGRGYGERVQVLVNGVDYTSAVVGDLSWNVRDGDHIVGFPANFRAAVLNPLDHLDATSGKSFVINKIVRGDGLGAQFTVPMFTGIIKGFGFVYDKRGQLVSRANVMSTSSQWDSKEVDLTLTMEPNAYNCVLADVQDECRVVQVGNGQATQLRVMAGVVRLDLTQIGKFGSYGGNSASGTYGNGGWQTFGWPYQTNSGSSTYQGGGVYTITVPDQVVNLLNFPDLNLTSEDFLGTKAIFVASNGRIAAVDGGPPVNAVALAAWEHVAVGDLICDNDILDTRIVRLSPEQATRAGVAEYVIRKAGFSTTNITFPTKYNDEVFSNVRITKKSLLTFLDQWFRPSRWKWYFDGSGQFCVVVDEIRDALFPAQWTYHQNNSIMIDISLPELGDGGIVSDVTIRGQRVKNNGIVMTKETTKTKTYGPRNEGTELGGGYAKLGGGSGGTQRLKLLAINNEERTLVGRTTIITETRQLRLRNPLKLSGAAIEGGRTRTPPDGPWGSGESTEDGIGFTYSKPQMELEGETISYGIYEGRLKVGHEKQVLRVRRKTSNAEDGIGVIVGGAADFGRLTGWTSLHEDLILDEVDQEKYRIGASGFVTEHIYNGYRHYNPSDNHEEAYGAGGPATRGAGHYKGISDSGGKPDEDLIRVLSRVIKYENLRSNPKLLRTTTIQEAFGKHAGRNYDDPGVKGVGDVAPGHTQSRIDSKETEVTIAEGSKPIAESLEDDIDRHEVFCQILHPVLDAAFTPTKKIDERVEYVETWEQASRVAREEMGRRASVHVAVQAPSNPCMQLFHSCDFDLYTPAMRRFQQRSRVVGYGHRVSAKATAPEATTIVAEVDYNKVRTPFLSGRT